MMHEFMHERSGQPTQSGPTWPGQPMGGAEDDWQAGRMPDWDGEMIGVKAGQEGRALSGWQAGPTPWSNSQLRIKFAY